MFGEATGRASNISLHKLLSRHLSIQPNRKHLGQGPSYTPRLDTPSEKSTSCMSSVTRQASACPERISSPTQSETWVLFLTKGGIQHKHLSILALLSELRIQQRTN